jgi:hypothetical protein
MHQRKIIILFAAALSLQAKKFYTDDPLPREPKPMNVEKATNRKLSDIYDLFFNQFKKPGEHQPEKGEPIRAKAVNTLGEPLAGTWWEPRHYYKRMTIEELQRGPGNWHIPSTNAKWTIVSAKTEGVTPGFVILDEKKDRYFIKFDPLSNPNMASSCDVIVSRLFHALGYHVPENNLIFFTPDQLVIGPDVTVPGKKGILRPMTREDLTLLFSKVPKTKDGKYRATASYSLPGKIVGPPRYYGTRADDPNDIVPHEHRRDLRGLHTIDAWVNHDDSRAINNADSLVKEDGVQFFRHYMLDFGSTLGSGTQKANSPRSGAYFFSWKDSAQQLFTLGLLPPYWALANYPDLPEVGRFEWKVFDPNRWVPEYHNAAFSNRLPDDEFWGAKLVTAFTGAEIRAIVETGKYDDKRSADWVTECLIKRRDKIGKTMFAKLLPLDQFIIEGDSLRWVDLGAKLGYLPESKLSFAWFAFDNDSSKKIPLSGQTSAKLPVFDNGKPYNGIYGVALTSAANPKHTIDIFIRDNRVVGIDRHW